MFLIILSWIYILFTSINLGFILNKIIDVKNKNIVVISILGLFTTTVIASIWAIFGRINFEFHLFLLLLNIFIGIKFKAEIVLIYTTFYKQFQGLLLSLKIYLIIISILIIAQCASIPYIIDNETYYIQTIKWINEYGFVKGLANLHISLAQLSGWHITQSAFNFSFIYKNFNDLSGFCLLLGNVFYIFKLNSYFKNRTKSFITIGLMPIANALLFQFISAPSSDLPIYIISIILFFYFIENYKNTKPNDYNLIVILSLFIIYIKPTSVITLLIPIVLLINNYKALIPKLIPSLIITAILFILYIAKNVIISGFPLFPLQIFHFSDYDFSLPADLNALFFSENKLYNFFLTRQEFKTMTSSQIFIRWLTINKINSFFNIISILLLLVLPYVIYKFINKKSYWGLYIIMVLHLIILFVTSPHFRFFIQFLLFFGFFILSYIFYNKKAIYILLFGSLIVVSIVSFVPIKYTYLTQNKLIIENSRFQIKNIIFPYKNSKLDTYYYKMKLGNLKYNSPDKKTSFWVNGDGDLPCVNSKQLEFFKKYYFYIPQQRTSNIKDGFYSKKLSQNE